MYHITPKRNIESILQHGLIAGKERGLTCFGCNTVIFLTNDPERILQTQAGDDWVAEYSPVILKIDEQHYHIEPHMYTAYDPPRISNFEFICNEHIKAKHISICMLA